MKWFCPSHSAYAYWSPGKCAICAKPLVYRDPVSLQLARAIIKDPKALQATVQILGGVLRTMGLR